MIRKGYCIGNFGSPRSSGGLVEIAPDIAHLMKDVYFVVSLVWTRFTRMHNISHKIIGRRFMFGSVLWWHQFSKIYAPLTIKKSKMCQNF